jgi:hypothetical protein
MRTSSQKLSAIFILLLFCLVGYTQKTDKVYLKNGDVVTGEIKNMKLAKMSFDMNGPGTISIKWEEVLRLTSEKTFEVTLENGVVLVTKIDSLFFQTQNVGIQEIVEIIQIRNRFLKRLSGDANLGFNYNKSNDLMQFNFASSTTYRIPKVEANFELNAVLSRSSSDTILSKKQDATASVLRSLNKRYYLMSYLGWERNTQLGLDNRYLIAGGGGKILFNDNQKRLLTGGGLSYNREKFNDSNQYKGNLEALGMVEFKRFRYTFPKINIDAQFSIFPSLSDWGRLRMNLQVNTSLEIFKDFSVGLTFYDNFDNRPSADAASKNDYGVTFNVGYTFGK